MVHLSIRAGLPDVRFKAVVSRENAGTGAEAGLSGIN